MDLGGVPAAASAVASAAEVEVDLDEMAVGVVQEGHIALHEEQRQGVAVVMMEGKIQYVHITGDWFCLFVLIFL